MVRTILVVVVAGSLLGASIYAVAHEDNGIVWTFGNLTGSGEPLDQMTEAQKLFNQNSDIVMTPQAYYDITKSNPDYVITERPVTDADRGIGVTNAVTGGNGGEISEECTVIWQAVDPAHPDQGGPGGCY